MFNWFKRRKKSPDIVELEKPADDNDKNTQYQLSMANYRDTSLAQKKKSEHGLDKAPEDDK